MGVAIKLNRMPQVLKILMPMTLIFAISIGYGQKKDSILKNIRILYKQINSDSTLKTVKLENEEFLHQMTDGGSSLTGFFKDNKICEIHVWLGLSFGVRQFYYYLKNNGQLFFIYETEEDYLRNNDTGSLDYTKLNLAFKGRYYFDEGKIIDVKNKGQRRYDPPSDFIKDVVSDGKSYAILLKSHVKKH
jgi:hypothetical protein